ncbi:hypothetical protein CVT24_002757 [Panaeolus cyanescens]|uniref:DNA ligase n=1 Tax=Panaeolus cyanescens TaxID=181874 RepID=A0A409VN50_9AGAR|nr:hypothetical protein CVT24_002757 [Panaeolus cyanescens]
MLATPAPTEPPGSPGPERQELPPSQTYPEPPHNVSTLPFGVLSSLFDKLQNERKHDRRRRHLEVWFMKDRERAVYGLKEKNLAKVYIELIGLTAHSPDAIRLMNWKKPTEKDKMSGDFSQALYDVVSKRSSVIDSTLTIDELNDILDELSKCSGKREPQRKILQKIYNRSTPEEQRWIVRIILKDMVISVKETTVFAVFHPDAQDLFNTCSDLKKVAWELWDTSHRLNAQDKAIQLFSAFTPMLCKRPTKKIEDTVREMGGSKFYIEEKLDGERMQLHKRGNEYFYCSRKGKDYTHLYGKHVGSGSLTPFIHSAFDSRVEEIILDGEMLVWDPVSERNLPFGTLKTAALGEIRRQLADSNQLTLSEDKSKKEDNARPCFKVFDLLYLNGRSLIEMSTKSRKTNLKSCFKPIPGRFEFAAEYMGSTAKDIRERMDEVMNNQGEGLVIKHPKAKYVLNGRNLDWIKVKPEYMDNMGETVDVLVVAGNYGTRKRGGGVSTLICAVFDDRRSYKDDEEPKYNSFVRIGTGLSFADYLWIREKNWKVWDPKHPPKFLETAKRGQEDKGDLYLEPQDSFILKVKAAEITPSDQYAMGYTMRFPRALSIRTDLDYADCMPASAILESMRSERKRKMDIETNITKKKRKVTTQKVTVLPQYQGLSRKGITVTSNLFEDEKFLVVSDPKSKTGEEDKKELTKLIYENGGTCVQVARDQIHPRVIYGGTIIPYDLQAIINKGTYDVLKPTWVTDSVEKQELQPLRKRYLFHAQAETMESEEYLDDDEAMREVTPVPGPSRAIKSDLDDAPVVPKLEELSSDMASWYTFDDEPHDAVPGSPEVLTDHDSDNDDVAGEGDIDFNDWFDVKAPVGAGEAPPLSEKAEGKKPEVKETKDVKMGETEDAMEYDTELIFRHLCFYLDTVENAKLNGIAVKENQRSKEISADFATVEKLIVENGGKIVGLDEPKLTHVVLDQRDQSRRLELIKRTSQPKRRHLVISEFIQTCLDEGTLLDETDYSP